ncbi:bifunctional tRNA (adenosine(37)-N6)-threonylcarbamoyltransferase complex dimerization subunit type 1 TsaB/ribosomal protein alanine acetyltransferase RimI [Bordetella petrii]|uniref:bifunctional tRNA (adenosine(37)-N6)-threonylcarbamoyltransferase complex dimerization subunit type 1 TsaB/ribosomal protein alanine acetyltransferase RimI n=1 Tax=Bordetella petrii TaxID=94624 RepID=UPI00047AAF18|nr:bifunctional tRNA (adenosine(37)-N6)-threonylcarbamoyltransferase complex dimerization subunit type 1 TsaB/ribosomal protein alanine acetyltransferase RimI [Bordetella petrii]
MEFNLLALETSSSRCGVALLRETAVGPVVSMREHEGSQEHAERLLPMAAELLAQAGLQASDLHAVAFGQGPGGFTGLRVACGVAQGMALALQVPVLPVVSHLAVAEQVDAVPGERVLVALDARMNEVYLAVYERRADAGHPWLTCQAPMLIAAHQAAAWAMYHLGGSPGAGEPAPVCVAGDAWDIYAAEMAVAPGWRRADVARPRADAVARLAREAWRRGEAVAPELAAPLYVRDKVAFTTAEREQGHGGNPKAAPAALPAAVLAPMTEADLDEVAALEAQVQAFPWTRGNFADALAAGYETRVLRVDGELAGFCVAMLAPDVAHLLVIAVARSRHRQGLGAMLLDWCVQCARERGLPAVLLEVRPSNQAALAFYERQGFRRIGMRRGYYPAAHGKREDALVMQKSLGDRA